MGVHNIVFFHHFNGTELYHRTSLPVSPLITFLPYPLYKHIKKRGQFHPWSRTGRFRMYQIGPNSIVARFSPSVQNKEGEGERGRMGGKGRGGERMGEERLGERRLQNPHLISWGSPIFQNNKECPFFCCHFRIEIRKWFADFSLSWQKMKKENYLPTSIQNNKKKKNIPKGTVQTHIPIQRNLISSLWKNPKHLEFQYRLNALYSLNLPLQPNAKMLLFHGIDISLQQYKGIPFKIYSTTKG